MWTAILSRSQVITSYQVHLWSSPSAAISQLGGFIRVLQFLCSDGRVFSGSRHHHFTLCCFCLGWKSVLSDWDLFLLVSFLYILFFPLISDSNITFSFWVQCFFLVYRFDRISGWLWVLFPVAYIHKHAPHRSQLQRDATDEMKWQEQVMRFLFPSSCRLFMISSFQHSAGDLIFMGCQMNEDEIKALLNRTNRNYFMKRLWMWFPEDVILVDGWSKLIRSNIAE